MPVLNKWDNDAKTVYIFIMRGQWEWSDYQMALSEGYDAIKQVEHQVDVIYAYVSPLPIGDAVKYLMLASEAQPNNVYRSVLVNPGRDILRVIIGSVDDMRNWEGPKFTDTIEEARQYLIDVAQAEQHPLDERNNHAMLEIVPIQEQHIESYNQCVNAVIAERKWLGTIELLAIDSTRQFVVSNVENDEAQFVALDGDTVIGWIDILKSRSQITAHVGQLGMGLLKDYRGQGIGTRLMQIVLKKAKAKGIERVQLDVYAHNIGAIKLYEKMGFQHEGVQIKAIKIDDQYIDLVQMALWIGD